MSVELATGFGQHALSPDSIFTEGDDVTRSLVQRRADRGLLAATRRDLLPGASAVLAHCAEPRAILFRQVATPTHEVIRFLELARAFSLRPLILEYHADKFQAAANRYKRALGRLPIYRHTGKDGRDIVQYRTLVDFNAYQGKPLSAVRCHSGEALIEFHHRALHKVTGYDPSLLCVDATPWFWTHGFAPAAYYLSIMTLCLRDGVLFETYEPTGPESAFARDVVVPAFNQAFTAYGHSPLVVRLLPEGEEMRQYWDSYPKEMEGLWGKTREVDV